MKYSQFIKSDIEKIRENANFNHEQESVFNELINPSYKTRYNDTAIYIKLNMSKDKFYRIKREINDKIERITGGK